MLCVNMSIHVYVSQTAGIQPLLAALLVKLSRSRVDRERQRVQHATFTHYKHTQSHPCVASLPGIQRGWQARKTTQLVQSDLLEHATVRKSRCESTGRCTGCEFARGRGKRHTFCPPAKQFLPTKKLHFRSDADNTVVYSNLLINIPQCGIRENTHRRIMLNMTQ